MDSNLRLKTHGTGRQMSVFIYGTKGSSSEVWCEQLIEAFTNRADNLYHEIDATGLIFHLDDVSFKACSREVFQQIADAKDLLSENSSVCIQPYENDQQVGFKIYMA